MQGSLNKILSLCAQQCCLLSAMFFNIGEFSQLDLPSAVPGEQKGRV